MMKKSFFVSAIVVSALLITSCSTPKELYSWHKYEDIVYQYNKKPTEELQAKVLEQYQKVTEKQNGIRGVVPPGMYAEYGFLLYKTGKQEEGLSFLKKEISLYPESEMYISRIIKQLEK
ncbi:DUF4810 domain-containing protein [uncultured Bacteroides sp.]|jgi:putative lipoprotein|uniref:DUF4810 domain-containing protein n=1 Tax=uncultured Bacteroides sp. TaxID=162156 RepID=UPI00280B67A0|nr:DUF4810 domain-containing protein [uncultured Bacteroides sp.]